MAKPIRVHPRFLFLLGSLLILGACDQDASDELVADRPALAADVDATAVDPVPDAPAVADVGGDPEPPLGPLSEPPATGSPAPPVEPADPPTPIDSLPPDDGVDGPGAAANGEAAPDGTPEPTGPAAALPPGEEAAAPGPLDLAAVPLLAVEEDAGLLQDVADADPEAGWRYAQRCAGCHSLAVEGPGPGGSELGPPLATIFGGIIGSVENFGAYSASFLALAEAGETWTATRLDAFLADPGQAIPGTTMSVRGIDDPIERLNVIAFLADLAERRAQADAVAETADVADLVAAADITTGANLAARLCGTCHNFDANGVASVGPNLFDLIGRPVGGEPDFIYSPALVALNDAGELWSLAFLDAFLAGPATAIPGTRMGMTGVRSATDRAAILAYLRQLSPDPVVLDVTIGVPTPGRVAVAFGIDQVGRGEELYGVLGCGNCHGPDLRGDIDIGGFGDAPPLIGPSFERRWFTRDLLELMTYLQAQKLDDAAPEIDSAGAVALLAFILQANGFLPGPAALSTDPAILAETGFFQ